MPTVCFVLSGPALSPERQSLAFDFANRLARDGVCVHVVFVPALALKARFLARRLARTVRHPTCLFRCRAVSAPSWLPLDEAIQVHRVPSLREALIPDADAIFATAPDTARAVASYGPNKGRKLYLLPPLVDDKAMSPAMRESLTWPLRKIATSRYMATLLEAAGQEADLVYPGIDASALGIEVPPEQRDPHTLLVRVSGAPASSVRVALDAVLRVQGQIPRTRLLLIGRVPPTISKPLFVEHFEAPDDPTLRQLYNRASIALVPAGSERRALVDAFGSGCAVISSSIPSDEMLEPERNALSCPAGDAASLARAVFRFFGDEPLRITCAYAGHLTSRERGWEDALSELHRILDDEVSGYPDLAKVRPRRADGVVAPQTDPNVGGARASTSRPGAGPSAEL